MSSHLVSSHLSSFDLTVTSQNGFWLSLGWCCAFLVPAVFLSLYVTLRLPPHPTAPPQAPAAFSKG